MLGKLFRKLEHTFILTGLIKDFGVISICDTKYKSCEVSAYLRNVNNQIILTLRHVNSTTGTVNTQYLSFDADGISALEHLIHEIKDFANKELELTGNAS